MSGSVSIVVFVFYQCRYNSAVGIHHQKTICLMLPVYLCFTSNIAVGNVTCLKDYFK